MLFKVNQVPRYQRQIGSPVETSTDAHKNNHKRLSHETSTTKDTERERGKEKERDRSLMKRITRISLELRNVTLASQNVCFWVSVDRQYEKRKQRRNIMLGEEKKNSEKCLSVI